MDGVIASKWSGQDGFGLYVGQRVRSCDPETFGGAEGDAACPFKARASLFIKQGNKQRRVYTKNGVIGENQWHHVAATIQPDDGSVKLFIDGQSRTVEDTDLTPCIDGCDESKDCIDSCKSETPRLQIGPINNAPLMIGSPAPRRIDDVRLWSKVRSDAQISGAQSVLNRHCVQEPQNADFASNPLIARYQFDYDDTSDRGPRFYDPAVERFIAHNTRVYAPGAPALHGHYHGGSTPNIDINDNDLYVKLVVSLGQPETSGLWVKSGMDIDLPFDVLDRKYSTETTYSVAAASSMIYAREFPILSLGPPGFSAGEFMLGGSGPNLRPNDYDDGLFAEFDLRAKPFPSFTATGRLHFREPNNGPKTDIAVGDVWFKCHQADPDDCKGLDDYVFHSEGRVNLSVNLPDGLGRLGVTGFHKFDSHSFDENGNRWGPRFEIGGVNADGSTCSPEDPNCPSLVTVFGKNLLSGSVYIDENKLKLTAGLDLGFVGGVNFGLQHPSSIWKWSLSPNPRMCGESSTKLAVPGLAEFDGTLKVCLGDNPSFFFDADGQASLVGFQLAQLSVCMSVNDGRGCQGAPGGNQQGLFLSGELTIPPGMNPPILTGNINGYFVDENTFDLSGRATLNVAGLTLADAVVEFGSTRGVFVSAEANLGFVSSQVSGRIGNDGTFDLKGAVGWGIPDVSRIDGIVRIRNAGITIDAEVTVLGITTNAVANVEVQGGRVVKIEFVLSGDMELPVIGQLADSDAKLTITPDSNPEVEITIDGNYAVPMLGGFYVSGRIASNGDFTLKSEATPSVFFGDLISATGSLTIERSGGNATVNYDGNFTLLGINGETSGNLVVVGGKVQNIDLSVSGDVGIPTGDGTFTLAEGTARFTHDSTCIPARQRIDERREICENSRVDGELFRTCRPGLVTVERNTTGCINARRQLTVSGENDLPLLGKFSFTGDIRSDGFSLTGAARSVDIFGDVASFNGQSLSRRGGSTRIPGRVICWSSIGRFGGRRRLSMHRRKLPSRAYALGSIKK